MGFTPYGTFDEGADSNRFETLYVDTFYLSRELLLMDNAVIRSHNFTAGSGGFVLRQDGSAEFNDIVVRGTIEAGVGSDVDWSYISNVSVTNADIVSLAVSKITGGTYGDSDITFDSGSDLKSSNYVAATSGWRIRGNGDAEFNNITAYGTITTAASGSRVELGSGTGLGYIDWYSATARGGVMYAGNDDLFLLGSDDITLQAGWTSGSGKITIDSDIGVEIRVGSGYTIDAKEGANGPYEIFPKGTLIAMGTVTDTTDQTPPAAETAYYQNAIACDYASQQVYVQVTVKARWKNIVNGDYFWCRPGIAGAGLGLVAIDEGLTGMTYHTQECTWAGAATANVSGNIVLSLNAYAQNASADLEEGQISYAIWRR